MWDAGRGQQTEILIPRSQIQKVFTDKSRALRVCQEAGVLIRDGGKGRTMQAKRFLIEGETPLRIFSFSLNGLANSLSLDHDWVRSQRRKARSGAKRNAKRPTLNWC